MYKYKKVKRISSNLFEDGNKRYIVSLDNHVELMEALTAFCKHVRIITGNISHKDKEVYLHVHATCSRADYSCVGGHLLSARVNGACELLVDKFGDTEVGRRFDEETGLYLFEF